MKKNLRIVSAAAAALLAVAPVAASAVSVNAADSATNVTNITLGGTSAPAIKSDVTISSNLSAVTKPNAVLKDTTNGNNIAYYNWDGKVTGTITGTWNGTAYTANLTPKESAVRVYWLNSDTNQYVEVSKGKNGLYALEPNVTYYVSVPAATFNFGSANANKKGLTLAPAAGSHIRLIRGNEWADSIKFDTDANGTMINPKGFDVFIPVKALDTSNTEGVSFVERATNNVVRTGNVSVNAVNDNVNVSTLLSAIKSKYVAHQLEANANVSASITTTEADLTDQLKKQNIPVDSLGNFKAPASFTVNITAKAGANGAAETMPVTVSVPNAAQTPAAQETTKNVTIMHISTIYDKTGKATNEPALRAYDTVSVVSDPVTINGAKFYKLAGKDQYIKVGNVDGTSRTLKHNSYVYKSSGKRANKKTLKKGSSVTTYGKSFMIAGHQMYRIGKNQYVKKANF